MRLEGWHIVIIIVLAIVLFGAPKLPGLARSVGQSLRIFKSEVKQMKDENNAPDDGSGPVEGRVVSTPAQQTYTPTYQAPVQPEHHQQPAQHHAGDVPPQGTGHGAAPAGPAHPSGTSNTNP